MSKPSLEDVIYYDATNRRISTDDEEIVLYKYLFFQWYRGLDWEEKLQNKIELEQVFGVGVNDIDEERLKGERNRIQNRLSQRARRQIRSGEEKERALERNRNAQRKRRSAMDEEEREKARERDRNAQRKRRSEMKEEETEKARERARNAQRKRRSVMEEEEKEKARERDRTAQRKRRSVMEEQKKEEERLRNWTAKQKRASETTDEARDVQRERNTEARRLQRTNLLEEHRLRANEGRQSARARARNQEFERRQSFLDKLLEKHLRQNDSSIFELEFSDMDALLTEAHSGMLGVPLVCSVCDCIQVHATSNGNVQMKALTEDLARKLSSLRKTEDLSPMLLDEYDITSLCDNLNEETKAAFKQLWLSPRGLYTATEDGEWRAVDKRSCVYAVGETLRI